MLEGVDVGTVNQWLEAAHFERRLLSGEWEVPVTRNAKITGGSKNSKANRIETGERSGGIGEICSVEVEEK